MKRPHCLRIFFLPLFFVLFFSGTAGAHPHAFVECQLTFVFDKDGLAGLQQRWMLDEMLTPDHSGKSSTPTTTLRSVRRNPEKPAR